MKKQQFSHHKPENLNSRSSESGKVHVKFFWKTGLIISIILSIIGTLLLNLILNS